MPVICGYIQELELAQEKINSNFNDMKIWNVCCFYNLLLSGCRHVFVPQMFSRSEIVQRIAICRDQSDKCERPPKLPIFVDENRVCSEKIVMYVADGWMQAANT